MTDLTMIEGLVEEINGERRTTSLLIAEKFVKRHSDVLRAIDNLEISNDFRQRHFAFSSKATSMPNGGGREQRFCSVARDGFMFLAMGFTGSKAAQWKERFIQAFNDATQPRSATELILMQAQALVDQERAVVQLSGRVDSIDSKVESLELRFTTERINEFPDGCDRLPAIASTFFPGMSPAKVSRWLNANEHPAKEYKISTDDGEVRSIAVFVKAGIEESRSKLMREATLVSECPRNTKYNHPKIGNFMIKKMSHIRSFMVSDSSNRRLDA